MQLLLQPWNAEVIAAITKPEILIGTFSYLLVKPVLKNSGLVCLPQSS